MSLIRQMKLQGNTSDKTADINNGELSVTDRLTRELLTQQKITNAYLSIIVNEKLTEKDIK